MQRSNNRNMSLRARICSFTQPGAGNKLDEANYGTSVTAHVAHIRPVYARSQEAALILQKHTQSHPGASTRATHNRKHAQSHARPTRAPSGRMFALRGQEITRVCESSETSNTLQVHMPGSFTPLWVTVCLLVCVCVCVNRTLFICCQTRARVYPESHITGTGFPPPPFPITTWISRRRSAEHLTKQQCEESSWCRGPAPQSRIPGTTTKQWSRDLLRSPSATCQPNPYLSAFYDLNFHEMRPLLGLLPY